MAFKKFNAREHIHGLAQAAARIQAEERLTQIQSEGVGDDCVLQYMLKHKVHLTRRNYLALAFLDPDYVPGPQEEAEIPEVFQLDENGREPQTSKFVN